MDGLQHGQVDLMLRVLGGVTALYLVAIGARAVFAWRARREMRRYVAAEIRAMQLAHRIAPPRNR